MAWLCRFLTARRSPHGRVVAENAPDALVDVHTGLDAKLTGPVAERALAQTQQLAALGNLDARKPRTMDLQQLAPEQRLALQDSAPPRPRRRLAG